MTQHIPLKVFAELPSTSSYVQEQLKAGQKAPFAVFAKTQNAGRGRLGRQWQSPEGNLYLSMALPVEGLSPHVVARIPLYMATLVAQWLQRTYGIRITLKWPNDLLFAGAKCGGILCEATAVSGVVSDVVFGLGLNLQHAPQVEDQRTIALKTVAPEFSWDPEKVAKDLVQFLSDRIDWRQLQDVVSGFAAYAIENGQMFVDENAPSSFHHLGALQQDGMLNLRSEEGKTQSLTSAEHSFVWLYQWNKGNVPVVVADVGNTAVKVALFSSVHEPTPTETWTVRHQDGVGDVFANLRAALVRMGFPQAWPIHVASVHDVALPQLQAAAKPYQLHLMLVSRRPLRLRLTDYPLARLGIDRLAAVEHILAKHDAALHGHVVVSAGTAITVDAILPGRWHGGGWILPGLQAQLDAMHQTTHLLPQLAVHPEAGGPSFGRNTEEAMQQGVLAAAVGAVREAVRLVQASCSEMPRVWLGGGSALALQRWLPQASIEPTMVLGGIRALSVGGFAE